MTPIDDAGAMRRDFDAAFASPRPEPARRGVGVAVIAAGGSTWALLLDHLAGLHPIAAIAPLPNADPALLGIAAVRMELVPVYRLDVLLDRPARASTMLAQLRHAQPIALAFDAFSGYERVDPDRIALRPSSGEGAPLLGDVRAASGDHPILDVPRLVRRLDRSSTPGTTRP